MKQCTGRAEKLQVVVDELCLCTGAGGLVFYNRLHFYMNFILSMMRSESVE